MSDPSIAHLLDGACAHGGAIAHEAHRLAIGRRDREAMSRAKYWRLLDRSHYFLAGRIETPRAAGTSPLEVIGPSL